MTNYTKTIEANDAIGFFVSGKDGNFYVQRVIRPCARSPQPGPAATHHCIFTPERTQKAPRRAGRRAS